MNIAAQVHTLYGLLNFGRDAWDEHCALLDECFFIGDYREIYKTIETLHSNSQMVDIITVTEALNDSPAVGLLAQISEAWVSKHVLGGYVADLRQQFHEGLAKDIGAQLAESGDVEAAMAALENIGVFNAQSETVDGRTAMKALWEDVTAKKYSDHIGLATGITDLDALLGGLNPGDLILLAARPRMGKTALMLNIAKNVDCKVGIFSLEMPTPKLMARLVSSCGIDHDAMKHPKNLTDVDWRRMTEAGVQVQDGLFINDSGGISMAAIESEARRLVNHRQVGLICIDYLQLITLKAENRLQVVSEVSRRLKALAKNLKVPIIALCQLNRMSEDKLNPVPMLSHLRESGQLEQDADVVIFIHRSEVYDRGDRPGEADLTVAKNRDGVEGKVSVCWQGRFQRFVNLSRDSYQRTSA